MVQLSAANPTAATVSKQSEQEYQEDPFKLIYYLNDWLDGRLPN